MADMTLREADKILKSRNQRLSLSHSGGQYHAYVFQGDTLSHYDRGGDLAESVERALGERSAKP
jgi:hypothetical protein